MNKESDVRFVRIRGRIVPIRKKQATGAAQVAAGAAISSAAAVKAASMVKTSWKAYGRSANIRGGIALMKGRVPSSVVAGQYKDAARFAVTGKSLARRGFGLLSVGLAIGGGIASVGASKFAQNEDAKQTLSDIASGVVVSGLAFKIFKSKVGIKKAAGVLGKAGSFKSRDAVRAFSSVGSAKTRQTVRKYESIVRMKQRTKSEKGLDMLNKQLKKRKKPEIPGQMKFDV